MFTRARTLTTALITLATVAAACGSTASTAGASGAAPRVLPRATTTPVAALATDQGCTAQAPAGSTLQTTRFRTDDLAAMTVPKSSFGTALTHYDVDYAHYGYMDNVELARPDLFVVPKGGCTLTRTNGRITGFSRGFGGPIQTLSTRADLFFSPAGAAAWMKGFANGIKSAVGTQNVRSAAVTSMPTLGAGAVRITARIGQSVMTWIVFRRAQIVGVVLNHRDGGTNPVVNLTTAAQKLSSRIATRTATVNARAQDPIDAVVALSTGLPKSMLGTKYAGLEWGWLFGGCWDPVEAASQLDSAAARLYLANASKYGMLTFCRALYEPRNNQPFYNGIERVFTGGTLYKSVTGAKGQFAASVREWQAKANTVKFTVGALGDQAAGFQQKGTVTYTRIFFRKGRYIAVAQLGAKTRTGAVADVKRWAAMLNSRIDALLASRTF